MEDGRIFLSGGYNAGSMMLQLKDVRGFNPRTNGAASSFIKQTAGSSVERAASSLVERVADSLENYPYIAETLFRLKPQVFGATQQTPIFYDGYIYGVRPDEELVCLNPDGEVIWASGAANRFGLGPFMIANGLIYLMNDSGLLTLAEATPKGYNQLAQAQVLHGHDSWGPMAMAGGRLIVRDLTKMVCLDVRGK